MQTLNIFLVSSVIGTLLYSLYDIKLSLCMRPLRHAMVMQQLRKRLKRISQKYPEFKRINLRLQFYVAAKYIL